ncbi:glycosyltransferase [Nocardioides hwasunensis]|uniref:Glycosyltransferase n=1 Tax=Nocardioides hwasunensis TaxID=397258 RepID=A0ABR8MNN6_9ACTN|nr:glycosyltransferase [Nocardioides hwasunensis]MBD3916641.1 glycosyltransferase [Nocardioides hwasunensis]
MKVCVLATHYVPAHKAGGPVPGIVGVVETMRDHDVHVLTADRDLGDTKPFPLPYRGTTAVDGVAVTYLRPLSASSLWQWGRAWRTVRRSDVVYFNSVMSLGFTIVPLLLLWVTRYRGRVAISPRGELAGSALRLGGSTQKQTWLRMMGRLGLHAHLGRSRVLWVASSVGECSDVLAIFDDAEVVTLPERLRSRHEVQRTSASLVNGLRVVAVGRLAPVKGHDDLLRALTKVQRPVEVQIVGVEEDPTHAAELHRLAAGAPGHVRVTFTGPQHPEEVDRSLAAAHLFVLLTHGENFGHAIGEALRAGCPVLISDQTPWSGVAEAGAGIVLNVAERRDPVAVARAVDSFAGLSDAEWQSWSEKAGAFMMGSEPTPTLLDALRAEPEPFEDGHPD